jgi:hypothetical protein
MLQQKDVAQQSWQWHMIVRLLMLMLLLLLLLLLSGPRGLSWRDDKPAELCWIEAQVHTLAFINTACCAGHDCYHI